MIEKPATRRPWCIAHSEASLGWGGQEHRILAELAGFQERGSQVWLLAPPESQIIQRADKAGIPTVPLDFAKHRFPLNALHLARWLKQQRIEILNPHSSRDGWLLGVAGRLARVPFIVRTRHFDVPIPNPWLSRLVYVRLCDHILTTSPKVTDHLRACFGLPLERVTTVSTGVDLEQFAPVGPVAHLVPEAQTGKIPLIGMVTVIRHGKGCQTLVAAVKLLKEAGFPAHYVIVGEGPWRPSVEQIVREAKLAGDFTFAGHREDVPAVLRALSVLVIPSLQEAEPQTGLQALATQTPVIGSNVGGIPEIIRHGETGRLFPAGDAAALAAAIRETVENEAATRAWSARGRAFVAANHSRDLMLDKIEALYRRHLPEPRTE